MERYTIEGCDHIKHKHLAFEDRKLIEIRRNKDHRSMRSIAKEVGCSPSTISDEIKRGSIPLYNGKVIRYKAKAGQDAYERNRQACGRKSDALVKHVFLDYVEKNFKEHKWSLDACHGYALESGEFGKDEVVSTVSLYKYVEQGLIDIKPIELPEKPGRKPTKRHHAPENKRKYGRSIEERPKDIDKRDIFGNWECDLVIGSKTGGDKVLFTMAERKTRYLLVFELDNKSPQCVMKLMNQLLDQLGNHFNDVFRTITTDNGTEFSDLSDIEKVSNALIYYAHPYSSYEKGTIERHNRLIRRFIPKGKRIDDFPPSWIRKMAKWCNTLPRKRLNYHTPQDLFCREMEPYYCLAA